MNSISDALAHVAKVRQAFDTEAHWHEEGSPAPSPARTGSTESASLPGVMSTPMSPEMGEDSVVAYLEGLVASLLAEYDMSEEDAWDAVFACADSLASEGVLMALPEEDDEDYDTKLTQWLAQAQTVAFGASVGEFVASQAE